MPRKPKEENEQLAKVIGEQITEAMQRLNLSLTELHKRTGISRTVLLAYTRGTYAPGAREIRLLCDHLDVTPSVLLYGSNQVEKTPYKLGDIQLSEGGLDIVAFMVLVVRLTRQERQGLLTLAEAISAARDPEGHRAALASAKAMLANEAFTQALLAFGEQFGSSEALKQIQDQLEAQSK